MGQTSLQDEELLRRIAQGDSDALLTLHQRYADLIYSMARRVLGDAHLAEEVAQDVFIKLWRKSQSYDPARGSLSSWLLSVTRFAAIDRLRREGRRAPAQGESDQGEESASFSHLSDEESLAWEQGQHLRLLLDQLPAEQREILELAFFGGMTHAELAEYLHLPLGTVKGRLRLGLQKLRAQWLDESVPLVSTSQPANV